MARCRRKSPRPGATGGCISHEAPRHSIRAKVRRLHPAGAGHCHRPAGAADFHGHGGGHAEHRPRQRRGDPPERGQRPVRVLRPAQPAVLFPSRKRPDGTGERGFGCAVPQRPHPAERADHLHLGGRRARGPGRPAFNGEAAGRLPGRCSALFRGSDPRGNLRSGGGKPAG